MVFDTRRPVDLSALRDDPAFGTAVVTLYPTATVIRLTRPPGQSAMLYAAQTGWRVSLVPTIPRPAALTPLVTGDVMTFAAEAPGQVVSITDPRGGGTLLVGTQRVSGQAVLTERRTSQFILPITGQGIVVEPLSDAIDLRITQAGFVLSGGTAGLVLSPPQPMPGVTLEAAGLTPVVRVSATGDRRPGGAGQTAGGRRRDGPTAGARTAPACARREHDRSGVGRGGANPAAYHDEG